jgi:hypothetical protein
VIHYIGMYKKLYQVHLKTAVTTTLAKSKKVVELPSIYRFISEDLLSTRSLYYTKILTISFLSAILITQIIIQTSQLLHNMQASQATQAARQHIMGEASYWKNIANQYKGYRDIYFRIALLEYKLGNKGESQKYLNKVMELDPNFQPGEVLGEKIKR